MHNRAAIILAGGKAERFQSTPEKWQDKALAELFRKPFLIHAIERVQEVVEEVVVCVNDENRKAQYSEILSKYSIRDVRLLVDEQTNCLGGPIIGILTGLTGTKSDYCFTLPSDMPLMQPKVIERLFDSAKGALVTLPTWPNGQLETLAMVLKRLEALEIAKTLCQLKRPRSDDIVRGALNVMFLSIGEEIRTLDPELKSFININHKADLTRLKPRLAQGPVIENLRLNLGALPIAELHRLQGAATKFGEGKFLESAKIFSECSVRLEKEHSWFWAALSRENEGKSLLNLSKKEIDKRLAHDHQFKGKEALLKAVSNYESEEKLYEKACNAFLVERARSNKSWCEALVNEELKQNPLEVKQDSKLN